MSAIYVEYILEKWNTSILYYKIKFDQLNQLTKLLFQFLNGNEMFQMIELQVLILEENNDYLTWLNNTINWLKKSTNCIYSLTQSHCL